MNQKNNESITFQTELNEQISSLFNLKEDLRFSVGLVSEILESNIFNDFGRDSKLLIENFKKATELAFDRSEELKNSASQILKTTKNLSLNLNNTVLNNDKHELFNTLNDLQYINKILKDTSFTLHSEVNIYSKSEKTIQKKSTLIMESNKRLDTIIKLINEISTLCNTGISVSIRLSANLINLSEQFQFETSKNFSKRFNEEKDIILADFNNKLSQITLDFELKQKEIKAEFTEIKVNFKKIKNELDESHKKNYELKKTIDNYEETINSLSNLELEKVKNKIENFSSDSKRKAESHLNYLNSSLQIKFDEIKNEFETQKLNMNAEFDKAKDAKKSFVQLVQNAGIYNLTENYHSKANEEKTEYIKLRNYTSYALYAAIGCTVLILSVPIIEYWGSNPAVDINYFTILARMTISLMFFVLALYFSKQSSKHYECYQENHKTFLQLAALEPFMEKMEPQDKLDIRKQLIPIYFNQDGERRFSSNNDEIGLPQSFTSSIEKLIDAVKEVKLNHNSNKPDANS